MPSARSLLEYFITNLFINVCYDHSHEQLSSSNNYNNSQCTLCGVRNQHIYSVVVHEAPLLST